MELLSRKAWWLLTATWAVMIFNLSRASYSSASSAEIYLACPQLVIDFNSSPESWLDECLTPQIRPSLGVCGISGVPLQFTETGGRPPLVAKSRRLGTIGFGKLLAHG